MVIAYNIAASYNLNIVFLRSGKLWTNLLSNLDEKLIRLSGVKQIFYFRGRHTPPLLPGAHSIGRTLHAYGGTGRGGQASGKVGDCLAFECPVLPIPFSPRCPGPWNTHGVHQSVFQSHQALAQNRWAVLSRMYSTCSPSSNGLHHHSKWKESSIFIVIPVTLKSVGLAFKSAWFREAAIRHS